MVRRRAVLAIDDRPGEFEPMRIAVVAFAPRVLTLAACSDDERYCTFHKIAAGTVVPDQQDASEA